MSIATHPDSESLTRLERKRRHHQRMLAAAMAVAVLSCVLRVRSDERVEFRFVPGHPLPEVCGVRRFFGVECPGCGLTRSFIYLAQGNWRASLAEHRVGWLLALALLLQFPYRLAALHWIDRELFGRRLADLFTYGLLTVLFVDWALRIGWAAVRSLSG
ncbi:MAG TPA: DUF2752 domain-containing protein [Planctomycetaceae bacterium]|nr:DUF2752 domain-containing protein [Planctomycetaceae bacterium]